MSRLLDGSDDQLVFDIATALQTYTFGTWGVCFRLLAANGSWQAISNLHNAALTTATAGLERDDAASNPRLYLSHAAASAKTATGVEAADDWQFVIITKATGSATPRYHRRLDGGAGSGVSWTHANMDVAIANGALNTSRKLVYGAWQGGDRANMRLAFGFLIDEVVWDDADCELAWPNDSNGNGSAIQGHSKPPTHFHQFNQGSVTTVTDVMGNGGDEDTALRVGTAVDADEPVGWTYYSAGTNLVIQDATHGHTVDNAALTQTHVLTVADATHAHATDNAVLTQTHVLTVADATHAHTADSPALTQTHALTIADAAHSHAVDNAVLTQTHELTVADASHGHSADNLSLAGEGSLVIQDATHGHTVDNLTLTQTHILVIQDALHAHNADTVSMGDITTPTARIYIIDVSASRVTTVDSQARLFEVVASNRTYEIDAEERIYAVPGL